jgi:3'-5' exoribonuclease
VRTPIAELKPSQYLDGIYAIQNSQLGQTKAGKPFLKCLLADRSGRTPGRMWNITQELFDTLPTDGFVWVEGQSQPYQGEIQVIIQNIKAIDPTPEDLMELLPRTRFDIDQMWDELVSIMNRVEHMPLRHLAEQYFADEKLMDRFRQAPAAQNLHHAYIGGLLEHTLSLLRIAEAMLPHYPQLNADVVRMGLFIHDIGKCSELTWERGFGYTDEGQLVGHIARGALWLEEKARQCAAAGHPIPQPLLMVLHHIILSHHGQPQFGALKIPSTPEALLVSLLDNLDARMAMGIAATRLDEARDTEVGGRFTEKIWALETRLYRPDPTTID